MPPNPLVMKMKKKKKVVKRRKTIRDVLTMNCLVKLSV